MGSLFVERLFSLLLHLEFKLNAMGAIVYPEEFLSFHSNLFEERSISLGEKT